jgi:cytidyltransferase-like protein
MNLQTLPVSSRTNPIIYYNGTFDPPHEGHLSALEAAMKEKQAAAAVVVVCDGHNPKKPNKSSWESRRQMALTMFSKLNNTLVSPWAQDETKEYLLSRAHLITLIGTDLWESYSKRKKIAFQGVCVSLRNGEEPNYLTNLKDKEITYIHPEVQGFSSSKIRNYLRFHPEIYEGKSGSLGSELSKLDPRELEYIIENKLYYQSQEDRLRESREKVERYVAEHFFPGKEFNFTCLTDNSTDPKWGGKSGDLTFLASCDEQKVFIKEYVRPTHLEDCTSELNGMELLNSLSLSWSTGPKRILWRESDSLHSHLGVPFLEKPSLAKVFKNLDSPESIEEFISMCFCIGRSLSELHHARTYPPQPEVLKAETDRLNVRTKGRLNKLLPDKREQFSAILNSSYEEFMKNPGPHTYVHGDANFSNFIVDEKTGIVHMLDLERFSSMRTESGDPLGLPGEDYYRFLGNITWFNELNSVSSDVVNAAAEAFKEGYQTLPSLITPEAHRYFSNYWNLRNYKIEQKDLL